MPFRLRDKLWYLLLLLVPPLVAIPTAGNPQLVAAIAVGGPVLVLVLLLLLREPSLFLAILIAVYGSVQFLLQESGQFATGALQINASQVFVVIVTSLCVVRLALEFALGNQIPRFVSSVFGQLVLLAAIAQSLIWVAGGGGEVYAVTARVAACTVGFIFCFVFCRTERDLWNVWMGAAVASIAASLVALADLLIWRGSGLSMGSTYHRAAGGFGGPVATGTVSFVGLGLGAAALSCSGLSKRLRIMAYVTLIASAAGVLSTFTRTAIVGSMVLASLVLVHRDRSSGTLRRFIVFACLLGAFSIGYLFVSAETVLTRVKDIPGISNSTGGNVNAGSGRNMIWVSVLSLQLRSSLPAWLTGHGLMAVQRDLEQLIMIRLDAHNSTLDMLYDAGLIGLAAYGLSALTLLKNLRSAGRRESGRIGTLARFWFLYMIAYYLSTEMFNGFVYSVGARYFSLVMAGTLLGVSGASARSRVEAAVEPSNIELSSAGSGITG